MLDAGRVFFRLAMTEDNYFELGKEGLYADLDGEPENCWGILFHCIQGNIFRFNAEREVQRYSSTENDLRLKPDASNLAQVLDTASRDRTYEFKMVIDHAKRVFPAIREIVPRKIKDVTDGIEKLETYVGYYEPSIRREDLRVPLSGCGSGIAQALAMLYVAAVSDVSRTIIIDEPHSFLHPGAVRKLLEIFQEHDHHQYIMATHSPTAIMTTQQRTLLLVTRESNVSKVKSRNINDNSELEEALQELGTKRSDVFGMDAVIWVEGKTDETCFNLIMKDRMQPGVQIIGLVNTGDLEDKKHAQLAENIYEKLSGGVGILPSALAFIFDGDKRPDDFNETDTSAGRKHYLKRETFENYFLDYTGIAEILSDLINNESGEPPIQLSTPETVAKWLDDNKVKDKFYPDEMQYEPETWLENVNGARLLAAIFKELAHPTRKYKKVKDGEEITKRILALVENSDHFQEIVDLITSIVEKDRQPETT